ncbi:MAG TPA: methyltransferase domain-containing protein [Eudoraea sp.]|nr:methyltransferase domain-containing protein [Eudoraea sp.]
MDFSKRSTEKEWMDHPGITKKILKDVFRDINKVNDLLGGNRATLKAVAGIIRDCPKEEYTLLDVGCGDGSILRAIARYGRVKKIRMKLIGIDLNADALSIAAEKSGDYPEISFARRDILTLPEENEVCDILLCTLTMHHFSTRQIPLFLKKFVSMVAIGVVINDLQRSRLAYYLFKGFSAIFIGTDIARHDGQISIQSGFTKKELRGFSGMFPGVYHRISWKWAFRYVWVMRT